MQPMRTCLGCRKCLPKKELLKFTLRAGVVRHDRKGTEQGRSAYCCNNNRCLRDFCSNKKKLSRAFRVRDCQISVLLEDRE